MAKKRSKRKATRRPARKRTTTRKNESVLPKGVGRVKRRPIENSSFRINPANNGMILNISGWIPNKKKGRNEVPEERFEDNYIVKNRTQALNVAKKALK
jgi:hypothetical protein